MNRQTLFSQLVDALRSEVEQQTPLGILISKTKAQVLTHNLSPVDIPLDNVSANSSHGLSAKRLETVIEYIQTHLSDEILLRTLAKLTSISESHFSRLFKQSMGESPCQYIFRCRMEEAKRLLIKTDYQITKISLYVGYKNLSHFALQFRRWTGTTPRAFRKLNFGNA